jgi:hypothetical protein
MNNLEPLATLSIQDTEKPQTKQPPSTKNKQKQTNIQTNKKYATHAFKEELKSGHIYPFMQQKEPFMLYNMENPPNIWFKE